MNQQFSTFVAAIGSSSSRVSPSISLGAPGAVLSLVPHCRSIRRQPAPLLHSGTRPCRTDLGEVEHAQVGVHLEGVRGPAALLVALGGLAELAPVRQHVPEEHLLAELAPAPPLLAADTDTVTAASADKNTKTWLKGYH